MEKSPVHLKRKLMAVIYDMIAPPVNDDDPITPNEEVIIQALCELNQCENQYSQEVNYLFNKLKISTDFDGGNPEEDKPGKWVLIDESFPEEEVDDLEIEKAFNLGYRNYITDMGENPYEPGSSLWEFYTQGWDNAVIELKAAIVRKIKQL